MMPKGESVERKLARGDAYGAWYDKNVLQPALAGDVNPAAGDWVEKAWSKHLEEQIQRYNSGEETEFDVEPFLPLHDEPQPL